MKNVEPVVLQLRIDEVEPKILLDVFDMFCKCITAIYTCKSFDSVALK